MDTRKAILLVAVFLCVCLSASKAQYGDTRCKCVCPAQDAAGNATAKQKKVYIQEVPSSDCKCDVVVNPQRPTRQDFCLLCECRYEYRNTKTIKGVVIFIICVVSLLFVYMLFMLGLDPFLVQRRTKYQEQTNEEVNLDDQTVTQVPIDQEGHSYSSSRQRSIIGRVTDEQKKWKEVVQAQRQSVYNSHSMLN